MKVLFKIILVLVVLVAVLVVGRNVIVKTAVEKGVKATTGLPLSIQKLDLGLATTHIEIAGLNLLSSKEFNNEVMFSAPEIFVDYHLGDILKGKVHLEDVRLNFEKLVIIKSKEGKLNLDALKPKAKAQEASPKAAQESGTKEKSSAPQVQIDHLVVKVGKIVYKDYSQGATPVVKEYNVNISEEINTPTDLQSLLGFIASKAMAKTALSSLGDFNIDALKEGSIPQGTMDTIKGQADALRGMFNSPSGE